MEGFFRKQQEPSIKPPTGPPIPTVDRSLAPAPRSTPLPLFRHPSQNLRRYHAVEPRPSSDHRHIFPRDGERGSQDPRSRIRSQDRVVRLQKHYISSVLTTITGDICVRSPWSAPRISGPSHPYWVGIMSTGSWGCAVGLTRFLTVLLMSIKRWIRHVLRETIAESPAMASLATKIWSTFCYGFRRVESLSFVSPTTTSSQSFCKSCMYIYIYTI